MRKRKNVIEILTGEFTKVIIGIIAAIIIGSLVKFAVPLAFKPITENSTKPANQPSK